MGTWPLPTELTALITGLATPLHGRLAWRLLPLMAGALFAHGRRTVASWLRGASLGHDYKAYYYFLGALGRKCELLAALLLRRAVALLAPRGRLLFALDDTPTKRYGKQVEGAGVHHNPTPGPADHKFVYGHVWVTLAWVVRHPLWGTLALPLRALLYVRRQGIGLLEQGYGVRFETKLQMAARLIDWLADWLKFLGQPLWLVADGAYAKRPVLKQARARGVVVVSRLRKDAALWSVPTPPRPGQPRKRGPKPTYGKQAISLAKRAGHRGGWRSEPFVLYGEEVIKTYKTFLATYRPAYGLIRVVLVKERGGWEAFFCTDPQASVAQVLEAYADRAAVEQGFKDLKEVHGVGQQQVRNYWANVAAYHLGLWWHTLIELWAWARPQGRLCDRSASPWDDPERRPSHADKRKALRQECLRAGIRRAQGRRPPRRGFRAVLRRLLALVG
ncbi:MAG TPA: transposase [Gemmataceae bacterium]|nr:transposase [Gemmataceae bacterium]